MERVHQLVVGPQHVNIDGRFDEIEVRVGIDCRQERVVLLRAETPPLDYTSPPRANSTVGGSENV